MQTSQVCKWRGASTGVASVDQISARERKAPWELLGSGGVHVVSNFLKATLRYWRGHTSFFEFRGNVWGNKDVVNQAPGCGNGDICSVGVWLWNVFWIVWQYLVHVDFRLPNIKGAFPESASYLWKRRLSWNGQRSFWRPELVKPIGASGMGSYITVLFNVIHHQCTIRTWWWGMYCMRLGNAEEQCLVLLFMHSVWTNSTYIQHHSFLTVFGECQVLKGALRTF